MAFICEPCHKKLYKQHGFDAHLFRSRGPCEYCRIVSNCADCKQVAERTTKTRKEKEVFTVELVDKHYNKLRPVWEPIAKRAVDKAFKDVAKQYWIKDWKKEIKDPSTWIKDHPVNLALDDLEMAFWEQDCGWEGEEEAYEKMCKKMKMEPQLDPETARHDGMLGCAGKWADAWNRYQRTYAKKTYGVDINFGN